ATFTLPGLAGIVLTIGMAVDSNVLIYERMREELAKGSGFKVVVQNGFEKAFSAIFDGNVTSLLTAVILYMIGSDLIRGFAVTLFIGLLMSLFSCLTFGHLVFEILERKRWLKGLKMMQFLGETKFDFLGSKNVAFTGSLVLIGLGLAALFVRGGSNMDIDFSGGTMVTWEFVNPQTTSDIQARLDAQFPNGVTLEQLTLGDEKQSAKAGTRFRMRTSEQDQAKVSEAINKAFDDSDHALVRVTLGNFKVEPITEKLEGELGRFEGGNQTQLEFSGPLSESTVIEYVTAELGQVKTEGEGQKYESAQLLLSAKAVDGEKSTGDGRVKSQKFILRSTKDVEPSDLEKSLTAVQSRMANQPVFEEVNAFATSVANDTKRDAILAILASLVMIVGYMWVRFENVYFGYAAVAALAH
ncbi:MAG: protein translocase subunit SecDF, partial [Planctomycetes bacterium]|nr:protein translocase subunit SecDF [Planctomycetota bacterium]